MGTAPTMNQRLYAVGRAVGVTLSAFVVGILLLLIVGVLVLPVVSPGGLSPEAVVVVGLVVLQGIAFPLVAFAYLRLRGLPLSFVGVRRPSLRDLGWTVGGYVLAFGLAIGLLLFVSAIGAPTAERADQELLTNPDVLLLLVPLSLLLIGPGEELLFRGIVQGTLRERFSGPAAIVLASSMFAPAHLTALIGSPVALLVTISVLFVPSLVFGTAYERTENILVPALIHGLYNATIFGLIYVGITYAGADPNANGGQVLLASL